MRGLPLQTDPHAPALAHYTGLLEELRAEGSPEPLILTRREARLVKQAADVMHDLKKTLRTRFTTGAAVTETPVGVLVTRGEQTERYPTWLAFEAAYAQAFA